MVKIKSIRLVEIISIIGIIVVAPIWVIYFPDNFWPLLLIGLFIMMLFRNSGKRRSGEDDGLKVDLGMEGDWF